MPSVEIFRRLLLSTQCMLFTASISVGKPVRLMHMERRVLKAGKPKIRPGKPNAPPFFLYSRRWLLEAEIWDISPQIDFPSNSVITQTFRPFVDLPEVPSSESTHTKKPTIETTNELFSILFPLSLSTLSTLCLSTDTLIFSLDSISLQCTFPQTDELLIHPS